MKIYSAYDPPPKELLVCSKGEGKTKQSEAKACDINVIVKRFHKTGVLPIANRSAFFADVSQMGDYVTVMGHIREASEAFERLPSKVRKQFDNNPGLFLDFCADPANRQEMVDMGLIEDVGAVQDVPVDSQPAEKAEGA